MSSVPVTPSPSSSIAELRQRIEQGLLRERHRLRRALERAQQSGDAGELQAVAQRIEQSAGQVSARLHALPDVAYPEELPIAVRVDEIARAIEHHQVVIVCGETGSGKTTQLPKICLALKRGRGRA